MEHSSQLLKFTQACMQLATQQVPLYSSKFSKRTTRKHDTQRGATRLAKLPSLYDKLARKTIFQNRLFCDLVHNA